MQGQLQCICILNRSIKDAKYPEDGFTVYSNYSNGSMSMHNDLLMSTWCTYVISFMWNISNPYLDLRPSAVSLKTMLNLWTVPRPLTSPTPAPQMEQGEGEVVVGRKEENAL